MSLSSVSVAMFTQEDLSCAISGLFVELTSHLSLNCCHLLRNPGYVYKTTWLVQRSIDALYGMSLEACIGVDIGQPSKVKTTKVEALKVPSNKLRT